MPSRRRTLARLVVPTVAATVAALVLTGAPAVPAIAATGSDQSAPQDTTNDASRPDSVSASVTARASGHRVEDLSQHTETTRVYANPDGTWTAEASTEPAYVEDAQGTWHDVDPTLVERDGHLEPRYATTDLTLSDGGDSTFASLTQDGQKVDFHWPTTLPTPVIDGNVATYPDAVPGGGDLVVTATPTGFSHDIVLHQAPAAAENGTDPAWTIPVATHGADLATTTGGGLAITDPDHHDQQIATAQPPLMYDSAGLAPGQDITDPSLDPVADPDTDTGALDTTVAQNAAGTPTVKLSADAAFLTAPTTVYPVVIDPSFTVAPSGDTWVDSQTPTNQHASSVALETGYNGTYATRSFLAFDWTALSNLASKHVVSASLKMRNYNALSCAGSEIRAQRITSAWTVGINWNTQPSFATDDYASYTPAHGGPNCDTDWATWNVTNIVSYWAAHPAQNYGIRIKAADETTTASWREYRSANYTSTSVIPQLSVTYNTAPATPSAPEILAATSYTPSGGTAMPYTSDSTPVISTKVSDPDGGTARIAADFATSTTGSTIASCTSSYFTSGSAATCSPSSSLADGTYYVRTRTYDGTDYSGYSGWTKFGVVATQPPVPTISCPGHASGSWTDDAPAADLSCTITTTGSGISAPVSLTYIVDNTAKTVALSQSGSPHTTTVTVPKATGGHNILANVSGPSGLWASSPAEYAFGYGTFSLEASTGEAATTASGVPLKTTGNVTIQAAGPPAADKGGGTPGVVLKWRLAASGGDQDTAWTSITAADAGLSVSSDSTGVHVTGVWDSTQATHDAGLDTDLDSRLPHLLDLEVCVDYAAGEECTWNATPAQVLRIAHAFGDGFPTTDIEAGPDTGQAALWTGEAEFDATDTQLNAGANSLSVSRTAASFGGPADSTAAGVFGTGWTASLDGPQAGYAGWQVYDETRRDGTLEIVDTDGDVMAFAPASGQARRTTAAIKAGAWIALDSDTIESGVTAKITGTGAATTLTLTDPDGTTTTFQVTTAPTSSTDASFQASGVTEPGDASATSYSYDSANRVTRILAPAPAGVTCPATGALPTGCRGLQLAYATSTTATSSTPGDYTGQVATISTLVGSGSGAGAATTSTVVDAYAYDPAGRLVSVTDPRSNLTTGYTYDGTSGRIASITPPGQTPIDYTYNSDDQLAQVTRTRPSSDSPDGTADLTTIVYNVPTTNADAGTGDTNSGLPDLSTDTVATWNQPVAPTYAAAVFGPDHNLALGSHNDLAPSSLDDSDWPNATISYTDGRGYTTNTAAYGAGQWLLTDTEYDTLGNPIRELSTGDIAQIQAGQLAPEDAGTLTFYNRAQTATDGTTTLAADTEVTDTYDTARVATVPDGSGGTTTALVRPHTHTVYDQGAPNSGLDPATGQAYALPTTVRKTATDAGLILDPRDPSTITAPDDDLQTLSIVKTGYDNAIPGATGDQATAGWDQGLVSSTTTVMDDQVSGGHSGADPIVATTAYNAQGQTVSTSQPNSSGNDPGTRQTLYYTADAGTDTWTSANPGTSPVADCQNHPAWAGLVCRTRFAGDPTSGPSMVTTTDTYNDLQLVSTAAETATGDGTTTTRTTTTSYLPDGRVHATGIDVTGLGGSDPVPSTTDGYDPNTGLQSATTPSSGDPITIGYDAWGRKVAYDTGTGAGEGTTTTTYDAAGNVASVTDPAGTVTTTSYGGTDAAGNHEHRDLATSQTTTPTAGSAVTIAGSYDANANLVEQALPSGLSRETSYDNAGELTGLTYTGDVTTTDADGTPTTTHEADWLAWTQTYDAAGRVVDDTAPDGNSLAGTTGYARHYTYDPASRLVQVNDQTITPGNTGDSGGDGTVAACTTREYGFDGDGNRTSETTVPGTGATDTAPGACQTDPGATGATTTTWDHNLADRITNTGYTYDNLGRITTIPAADTPQQAAATVAGAADPGDLTIGYYDNDAVHTLTQNDQTTNYARDAANRAATETTAPTSGASGATSTTSLGYTDDTDSPSWEVTTTDPGDGTGTTSSTETYVADLSGDLAATLTDSTSGAGAESTQIVLNNPHGDTIAQITLPTDGSNAAGIDDWSKTDEYGNPLDPAQTATTPTNPAGQSAGDPTTSTGGLGYGWLGAKQRAETGPGLALMGARLYNPVTGTFTSTDPIWGGNTTPYAYPPDPINRFDLNGQWCSFCHRVYHGVRALGASAITTTNTVISFGGYVARSQLLASLYSWRRDLRFIARALYDDAHSFPSRYEPRHRRHRW